VQLPVLAVVGLPGAHNSLRTGRIADPGKCYHIVSEGAMCCRYDGFRRPFCVTWLTRQLWFGAIVSLRPVQVGGWDRRYQHDWTLEVALDYVGKRVRLKRDGAQEPFRLFRTFIKVSLKEEDRSSIFRSRQPDHAAFLDGAVHRSGWRLFQARDIHSVLPTRFGPANIDVRQNGS